MGQKLSTHTEAHSRTHFRSALSPSKPRSSITIGGDTSHSTPRSVDVSNVATNATMALKPAFINYAPPKPFATAMKNRRVDRSAFTFFSCGRNVFIHFVKIALLDRELIRKPVEVRALEESAEAVWIEVVMYDPQQRDFWEEAAKQAKDALTNGTITSDRLLESHGLPERQAEHRAWAASAVEELLARFEEERWEQKGEAQNAYQASQAGNKNLLRAGKGTVAKETVDSSLEREPVSAINLSDLQPHLTSGVEPSIKSYNHSSFYSRDADALTVRSLTPTPSCQSIYPYPRWGPVEQADEAATARRYLALNGTPAMSDRDSVYSIAPSLCTNAESEVDTETEEQIVTTKKVTPVRARVINC